MKNTALYFITALSFIITPYFKKLSKNSGNIDIYDAEQICNIIIYILYICYKKGKIKVNFKSLKYTILSVTVATIGRNCTNILLHSNNNVDDVIITSQSLCILFTLSKQFIIDQKYSVKKLFGGLLIYLGYNFLYL